MDGAEERLRASDRALADGLPRLARWISLAGGVGINGSTYSSNSIPTYRHEHLCTGRSRIPTYRPGFHTWIPQLFTASRPAAARDTYLPPELFVPLAQRIPTYPTWGGHVVVTLSLIPG